MWDKGGEGAKAGDPAELGGPLILGEESHTWYGAVEAAGKASDMGSVFVVYFSLSGATSYQGASLSHSLFVSHHLMSSVKAISPFCSPQFTWVIFLPIFGPCVPPSCIPFPLVDVPCRVRLGVSMRRKPGPRFGLIPKEVSNDPLPVPV